MFKMALVQMHVEGGDKQRNLRHAENLIFEAASNGADCVVLPEAMNLGWTHASNRTGADSIPDGETCQRLAEAAANHRVYTCSGLVEKSGVQVFNSAVLIDRCGNVVLTHRKLNELTIAHDFYSPGQRLNVCHTELGSIGIMICADAFAKGEVLSRSLCYMGADIILSPCAWAVPADHDNQREPYGQLWRDVYQAVAREYSVWFAGVSNVGPIGDGPWKGRICIGCSLVVNSDGEEVVQGPYGVDAETILYVDVDFDPSRPRVSHQP